MTNQNKKYIITKYVFAKSAEKALQREKKQEVDEIRLYEEPFEEDKTPPAVGFAKI